MISSSFRVEEKLFDSFSRNSDVSTGFAKSLPIVLFATYSLPFVVLRLTLKVPLQMRWSESSSTRLYVL